MKTKISALKKTVLLVALALVALTLSAPAQSLRGSFNTANLYFAPNGGSYTNYYWASSYPAYTNSANHGWMKTNSSTLRWEYYVNATLVATNRAATNIWRGTNGTSYFTSYWATASSPSSALPGAGGAGGSYSTNLPGMTTNAPAPNTNTLPQILIPSVLAGGTNSPEGVYTAGRGSLYNQFDTTGTNLTVQWIKGTTTGNTGWSARSANVVTNGQSTIYADSIERVGTGQVFIDTVNGRLMDVANNVIAFVWSDDHVANDVSGNTSANFNTRELIGNWTITNLPPAAVRATNSPVNGYALRYTNGAFYWAP